MANPIRDQLETETSRAQDETARLCQELLATGTQTKALPPPLQREKHIAFLQGALGPLPAGFVAVDASRPWILYWSLTAIYLLGGDTASYHERYVAFCHPISGSQDTLRAAVTRANVKIIPDIDG